MKSQANGILEQQFGFNQKSRMKSLRLIFRIVVYTVLILNTSFKFEILYLKINIIIKLTDHLRRFLILIKIN